MNINSINKHNDSDKKFNQYSSENPASQAMKEHHSNVYYNNKENINIDHLINNNNTNKNNISNNIYSDVISQEAYNYKKLSLLNKISSSNENHARNDLLEKKPLFNSNAEKDNKLFTEMNVNSPMEVIEEDLPKRDPYLPAIGGYKRENAYNNNLNSLNENNNNINNHKVSRLNNLMKFNNINVSHVNNISGNILNGKVSSAVRRDRDVSGLKGRNFFDEEKNVLGNMRDNLEKELEIKQNYAFKNRDYTLNDRDLVRNHHLKLNNANNLNSNYNYNFNKNILKENLPFLNLNSLNSHNYSSNYNNNSNFPVGLNTNLNANSNKINFIENMNYNNNINNINGFPSKYNSNIKPRNYEYLGNIKENNLQRLINNSNNNTSNIPLPIAVQIGNNSNSNYINNNNNNFEELFLKSKKKWEFDLNNKTGNNNNNNIFNPKKDSDDQAPMPNYNSRRKILKGLNAHNDKHDDNISNGLISLNANKKDKANLEDLNSAQLVDNPFTYNNIYNSSNHAAESEFKYESRRQQKLNKILN